MFPKLKNLYLKNLCIVSTFDVEKKRNVSSLNVFFFPVKRNQTLKEKWKTQLFLFNACAQYSITEETLGCVLHTKIERDRSQICFCFIFLENFRTIYWRFFLQNVWKKFNYFLYTNYIQNPFKYI